MVQLSSEKFNVAWFKLAEFVGRKEKERAMILYRLLVHSLSDQAFAAQLEGDLFLAFRDEKVIEAYKRAVTLYEESGRLIQAVAVYEQLVTLVAQDQALELYAKMLSLYKVLAYESKMARCAAHLITLLFQTDQANKAHEIFNGLTLGQENYLSGQHCALIHEAYVFGLLQGSPIDRSLVNQHIEGALDGFMYDHETKKLTTFMAKLAARDNDAYQYAYGHVRIPDSTL